MEWKATRCTCSSTPVLLDGTFQGIVRVVCPVCKRRIWLAGDGKRVLIAFTDPKPGKITTE